MTRPGRGKPIEQSARASSPSGNGIPNINPVTGLSTDYLNHFTEAIMAIEMAEAMPECLDDLRGWCPKSYIEHFAASRSVIGTRSCAPIGPLTQHCATHSTRLRRPSTLLWRLREMP